ncbi:unnamed protein product [Hydatigera taeniaeformis]|uniref:Uncharacterized protein n=1 Tax=Hydatigena taeniaeformis TaxID=6205 RepID=A0A0R3XAC5_HYDTA|nr:unnamed protein product [Hydatigera taeniaeformis]
METGNFFVNRGSLPSYSQAILIQNDPPIHRRTNAWRFSDAPRHSPANISPTQQNSTHLAATYSSSALFSILTIFSCSCFLVFFLFF